MNLLNAISTMNIVRTMTEDLMKEYLKSGNHILICEQHNEQIVVSHDYFIKDGVLFGGLLSEVNTDPIVITLKSAVIFDDKFFHSLWTEYISHKDIYMIDTTCTLNKAQVYSAQYELSTVIKQLSPGEMVFFNDPENPFDGIDDKTANVYIIDNVDATVFGINTLKDTIKNVHGLHIVDDPGKADFKILILPSAIKTPHRKIFEWLNKENRSIPVVASELQKTNTSSNELPILLYWTTNVILTGLFDSNAAMYKSTSELAGAVSRILKE